MNLLESYEDITEEKGINLFKDTDVINQLVNFKLREQHQELQNVNSMHVIES